MDTIASRTHLLFDCLIFGIGPISDSEFFVAFRIILVNDCSEYKQVTKNYLFIFKHAT